MPEQISNYIVRTYNKGEWSEKRDSLAVEEPLEIYVSEKENGESKLIATTMRTPGHDDELGVGFLYSENLIQSYEQVLTIEQTAENSVSLCVVKKTFKKIKEAESLNRYSFVNASCGICGRTSIEDLKEKGFKRVRPQLTVPARLILDLPQQMKSAQKVFHHTGGLHAAELFDGSGHSVCLREDIGRHNAVDKILGDTFLRNLVPLDNYIMMVSGRLSYEIVQKALSAKIPILAAVSAPSNLAVKVAHEFGITLIGFLRGETFNVYTYPERISAK
jgi:FdhD protein